VTDAAPIPESADAAPGYVGWALDPVEREALIERFPPRYARAVADHVTLAFGDRTAELPSETKGEIVGVADDGRGVQAMVVRIAGSTDRPDGSTFHVTWSLAEGREAVESNDVIARVGWRAFAVPAPLSLEPQRFPR
jgi:hypothetical protein